MSFSFKQLYFGMFELFVMSGQIKKILTGQVYKRISGQLKENMQANTKIKDTKEIAIIFPIKLFIFKIFTFIKYF